MEKVRCKFRCNSMTESEQSYSVQVPDDSERGFHYENKPRMMYSYKFSPVYSDKPDSENKQYWDATPSGSFEMGVISKRAFEPGKEYYIDVTPAE